MITKKELFEFFTSVPNPDINGMMKREKNFSKKYPELYKDFLKFKFDTDLCETPFAQKLWHFLQDDNGKLGRCKHCGCRSKFISFSVGYQNYCSSKCSNNDEKVKSKQYEEKIKLYGGVGYDSKIISSKAKNKMLEKYGVEYSSQSETIKQKIRNKQIEKYNGVGFASQSVVEKFKIIMNEKYGSDYAMQSEKIINKRRDNKITNDDRFISIDNQNFVLKCTNEKCDLCDEKCFTINRITYFTRIGRNQELCTKINPLHKFISCGETTLYDYIKTIYSGTIERNNRTVLDGKEIDIYLPDLKIGFEYNGDYWHANPIMYSSNDMIFEKTAKEKWIDIIEKQYNANMKNVSLYNIWETDWTTNDSIKTDVYEIIRNNIHELSSYFKLKKFIESLKKSFIEKNFGEFEFDNIIVKYIDCKYFNDFTQAKTIINETLKRVIYVYDFEINNETKFSIFKSIVRHAFGLTENRIFARKCKLIEITNKEAKPFLNENSMFGHRNAKLTLGLFYENELVMVYSFGHNFYGKKNNVEVIRVCTKKDTIVVGGSSKCLKYFLDNYSSWIEHSDLIFYVDRIHQDGNSLKDFKFIRHEFGTFNYWIKNYSDNDFIGIKGTAFNRMPSKHKQIKELNKKGFLTSVKTMGVDVWKLEKRFL